MAIWAMRESFSIRANTDSCRSDSPCTLWFQKTLQRKERGQGCPARAPLHAQNRRITPHCATATAQSPLTLADSHAPHCPVETAPILYTQINTGRLEVSNWVFVRPDMHQRNLRKHMVKKRTQWKWKKKGIIILFVKNPNSAYRGVKIRSRTHPWNLVSNRDLARIREDTGCEAVFPRDTGPVHWDQCVRLVCMLCETEWSDDNPWFANEDNRAY